MNDSKKLHHFHLRDFLCPPESHVDSFIHASIDLERSEWKKGKKTTVETYLNAELSLGACSDRIHWRYDASDKQSLTRARAKAEKTRSMLNQFFSELDIAFEDLDAELKAKSK